MIYMFSLMRIQVNIILILTAREGNMGNCHPENTNAEANIWNITRRPAVSPVASSITC